jgi:hypothetical protein
MDQHKKQNKNKLILPNEPEDYFDFLEVTSKREF